EPAATPAPARTVAVAAAPAPIAHKGEAAGGTALGPLKVDPTLLGLPPLPAPAAPPQIVNAVSDPQAEAEAMAPALPPRRRRGEDTENATPLPYVERDPGPALALRRSRNTAPPPKNDDPHPTFLTARRLYGVADREAVMEGDAEMRREGTVITSDRLVYWQNDDEVEATGNVVYSQEGTVVSGPSLTMKLDESTGVFDQAAYSIRQERKVPVWGVIGNSQAMGTRPTTGRGQSEQIEFLGENHIRLANATYTTCAPGNNDWYAKAESLDLNYDTEAGEGKKSTLYFKDVPIFHVPSMSFALNNQRKSGFLAPTFGTDSRSGAMLTAPYYWNVAPNMDLTVAPRMMTKRGLQIGGEFRYLDYNYNGYARGEYVPTDNVRNLDNRYAFNIWHQHNFGNGFSGLLNLNKVSDDFFYTDLSSRIGVSAQTLLPRQGMLTYSSTWWNATANINRYQTLQPDINNPVTAPYDVVPQLTLKARQPDYFGTDVALWAQYTAFNHPTKVTADRTVAYPQLSLPFIYPSFYVTPKVGLHITKYALGQQTPGNIDNYSRNVPIFSLDSGLTLERETSLFGSSFTQTLEPRLYYLYVPYRDHGTLYNQGLSFDTGLADFNFGQIFSENRYVGQDYIGDANQLTAAATTRFINPDSGREYFRALLGQRYYFSDQRVVLPGEQPRQHKNTNWLAAISGQILPKTYVDSAVEYNPYDGRTDRLSLTGRYQPETGKLLNAGYRYTRDVLGNLDISGQWPLGGGWYGVGRYNYSLKEKRVVENIAGLEYNGGCWIVRGVIQSYALTANTSSTAFFVQLELNDFSSIGSNPLDMLRRTIPGYGRINQPVADPVFGGIE
ncbi:MAG TPA: LPS-assembly protein LptD, partial [Azospira sp.]|nr:LPS-assembly protein LptD [Azospira sp.]